MAGHSKFKNIMHRKGAQDKKRAKVFTKIIREITVAVKMGGSSAESNPRLKMALLSARSANMPKDNIDRAIKKGSDSTSNENYYDIRYEGYGSGNVAIIVEALTDNKNRTASDIRAIFSKNGGSIGELGSVSFMFEKNGIVSHGTNQINSEDLINLAIDIGAKDIIEDDDAITIISTVEDFHNILTQTTEKFGNPIFSGLEWQPLTFISINDEQVEGLLKLINALEDHDDVQNVYTNVDLSQYDI